MPAPAPPTPAPEPPTPAPPPAPAPEPPAPFPGPSEPPAPAAGGGDQINLNTVTFEQLRASDLSVTQATRLLAHRERIGGFKSIDDLDGVDGFPAEVLASLKSRATV